MLGFRKHITISRRLLAGVSTAAIAATMAIGAGAPARAADTAAAKGDTLEEIVVSARRVEENIQSTPISVTAISGDFLKDLNLTHVQDIASFAPNLTVSDAPSNGFGTIVYLRGVGVISVQVSSDPPINIYVDGVIHARPTGNAFDLPDIDHVEVLRGPQGTLFGRNTTGGAIAIYTKRPSKDFGGTVDVSYGNENEYKLSGIINTGALGDTNIYSKATFQYHSRNGWVNTPGRSRRDWAGYDRSLDAAWSLAADPTDDFSIDNRAYFDKVNALAAYQLVAASATALAAFNTSPTLGGPPVILGTTPLDKWYSDPRRPYDPYAMEYGDALTMKYEVADYLTIKSITGYNGLVQKQTGQLGGSNLVGVVNLTSAGNTVTQSVNHATRNNSNRTTQITEELQALGKINDQYSYTAGVYYFYENIYENLETIVPTILATTHYNLQDQNSTYTPTSTSYAAYANLNYKPDDKFEIAAGIRYTYDDKDITRQRLNTNFSTTTANNNPILLGPEYLRNSWHNLGWSASGSYQWTPDFMLYVRGASAYRAGAYSAATVGSPVVNPETASSVEGGFKSEWMDKRVRVNAGIFTTFYSDIQINQRNAATAVSTVVNAGKAFFNGFEIESTAIVAEGLQIDGNLGHVIPHYSQYLFLDANGQPSNIAAIARFPFVSHWTFNVGGQYRFPDMGFGTLTARMDYAYQSSHYFQPVDSLSPNNSTQPSGDSKNLRARLSLTDIPVATGVLQNVEVQLYGDNLTDNRYRVSVVDFGTYATANFSRPRTFGARIVANF